MSIGPNKFINPYISLIGNKWMLSFSMECENQARKNLKEIMGIDLGIKETMTVAFDE